MAMQYNNIKIPKTHTKSFVQVIGISLFLKLNLDYYKQNLVLYIEGIQNYYSFFVYIF